MSTYYYFGISVVDPNVTTAAQELSGDIHNAHYSYGTNHVTPWGFPTPGTPSIFNCDSIGKVTWSSDGRKLAFDVGRISTDLVTQSRGDVYTIDVSNLAHPGAPYNVTRDAISYYPCASPANLGTVIAPPVPAAPAYLAEGTTRPNFDEFLALANPNNTDIDVLLNYALGGGAGNNGGATTQKVHIKAMSRQTVKVRDTVGDNQDVSVSATCDKGVIVERPMYFNYGADKGYNWTGGHDVVGASCALKNWYFAEGTTRHNPSDGAYDEYLCLQNPGNAEAKVTITYMLGSGENKNQEIAVKANSRSTVSVNGFLGPNQDVSCKVHSDKEIVAERPVYFNTRNGWNGGHDVIGAIGPKTNWYFAEGTTRDNFSEWLCLQNPGSKDANVTITYLLASGQNIEQKILVKARSRSTVDVKMKIGANQDASAKIISDQGIIAERPMYFNYNGVWAGGHDVIGFSP